MQFTVVTAAAAAVALFGSAALATPAPVPQVGDVREVLTIRDFSAHKAIVPGTTDTKVDGLSYKLLGTRPEGGFGLACTAAAAAGADEIAYAPTTHDCNGDDDKFNYYYSVVKVDDKDVFTLNVFRQVTFGWGYQAQVEVPTYCHAGGNDSMACAQIGGDITVNMHP